MANKLDPRECDFLREYLESDELLRSEGGTAHAQWAVKGQLMRGGPVGTALVLRLLQRLTSTRPLTQAAVESFLSVVAEDSGYQSQLPSSTGIITIPQIIIIIKLDLGGLLCFCLFSLNFALDLSAENHHRVLPFHRQKFFAQTATKLLELYFSTENER